MTTTYAFSVHNFIDKVGSYAGFAAIIGLALFTLLLFAQARELRRLREWGSQAHDRIAELERGIATALDLARRQPAPPRQAPAAGRPAPAAARRAGAAAGRAMPAAAAAAGATAAARSPQVAATAAPTRYPLLPAAPAGVGGPALASATPLIPLPDSPSASGGGAAVPATAAPAVAPARRRPMATTAAAAARTAPAAAASAARDAGAATVVEPPSGGNGHYDDDSEELPLPPRRATPAPRRPAPAGPPRRPAGPAGPARGSGVAQPPRGGYDEDVPHGRRRLFAILGGVAAVIVVIVVIVLETSGSSGNGGSTLSSTQARSTTTARQHRRTATTPRRRRAPATPQIPANQINVSVLNGTATVGLALTVADQLSAAGYVRGTVANADTNQASATVVMYTAGHENEAREVANSLRLPADAVTEIDEETQARCGNGVTTSCPSNVVVTVGADHASSTGTTGSTTTPSTQ